MTDRVTNFSQLERAVSALLARAPERTAESIRNLIGQCRLAPMFEISDEEAEKLARLMEERHSHTMGLGSMVSDGRFEPWLEAARASIVPYYWERYEKLLADRDWSGNVIGVLDKTTDDVLGLMGDPRKEQAWDWRGMVVGNVQSGKTAHYVGLMCKAADAGYKLLVVIAGIHNNLRNQTQRRVDEGFVGRDSSTLGTSNKARPIGVGLHDSSVRPVTFTTSLRDFDKATATSIGVPLRSLNVPAVLVIKKNPSTLRHLLEWLQDNNAGAESGQVDFPLLVIDDEADNASINVAYSRDEVSKINGQIRLLLSRFSRSTYVGYTATPFANIFIDPDTDQEMLGQDLFPRHFIKSLDPPSNYIGPNRMFDEDAASIRTIRDNGDILPAVHKISLEVRALPESLLEALRVYLLTRAIRTCRGHGRAHSSMLVNVSRFTRVQSQIAGLLHDATKRMQRSARLHGALSAAEALRDPEVAALNEIWEREFSDAGPPWSEVLRELHGAIAPVSVIEVNAGSAHGLHYETHGEHGLHAVVVGGLSLSRGLTLEGLTVSYLLRNSKMYDTLLQMGRWFGYRPNYEDLCRLYMTEEMEGWYAKIAEATETLRDELREMEASGATPEQFGLKVRAHPETLLITARNKIGSGQAVGVRVGLSNAFIETATLPRGDALQRNRDAAAALIATIVRDGNARRAVPGGTLLTGVSPQVVLTFLSQFVNHEASILTSPEPVRAYIQDRMDSELHRWDVLIAHTSGDGSRLTFGLGDTTLSCQRRTAGVRSTPNAIRITNKQRVASRGIERTGVDPHVAQAAERAFENEHPEARRPDGTINYPDRIYRQVRTNPLLVLHHLEVLGEDGQRLVGDPVVAWGISFPTSARHEELVTYMVNRTWWEMNFGNTDEGESDEELD